MSKWFSSGKQYLLFNQAGYADLIEGEITKSRDLLQKVISTAKTPEQKNRARLVFRAFEYYEASILSYHNKDRCSGSKTLSFGDDCDLYKKMKEKRFILVNEFENDPMLIHPSRFDKLGILKW